MIMLVKPTVFKVYIIVSPLVQIRKTKINDIFIKELLSSIPANIRLLCVISFLYKDLLNLFSSKCK